MLKGLEHTPEGRAIRMEFFDRLLEIASELSKDTTKRDDGSDTSNETTNTG